MIKPMHTLLAIPAALLVGSTAFAATPTPPDAQARYHSERAACLAKPAGDTRATCLREAGAALAEARRGALDKGLDVEARRANALKRCQVHADDDDRLACERMALGDGKASGSVADGAVVKTLVTRSVEGDSAPSR